MDHNSNPKPQILKGSQSKRQPAARAAQFNKALEPTAHYPMFFAQEVSGLLVPQLGGGSAWNR